MKHPHRLRAGTCLALSALPLLAGCSDDDVPPDAAEVHVMLTDDAADELASFSADVAGVQLQREDGSLTGNLMTGVLRVEFLGLDDASVWLASTAVDTGPFEALELVFQPFSFDARDFAGNPVTVDALSTTFAVTLPAPVELSNDEAARFDVDLDLAASLEGDVGSGTVVFDPRGSATVGQETLPLEEIEGIVRDFSQTEGRLTVDAFADTDLDVSLGESTVTLTPDARLFALDGGEFEDPEAFFEALVRGQTVLEIHGALTAGGVVSSDRVEVVDAAADDGPDGVVRIEGRILGLDPESLLELSVNDVEKGADVAEPVLETLGDPFSIFVALGPATNVVEADGTPTELSALQVGQEVKVRFAEFVSEPFFAARIEIEGLDPEREGTIVATSVLPGEFLMHLHPLDPAIQAGLVESSTTDVVVSLDGAPIFLDTPGQPLLSVDDLSEGLRVAVRGALQGPPEDPTLFASDLLVRAGRLDDATVTFVAADGSLIETLGGEVEDPFGGTISRGPLRVTLPPSAVVQGEAGQRSDLLELFAGLELGEALLVRVEGVAGDAPAEVDGYLVDARVAFD